MSATTVVMKGAIVNVIIVWIMPQINANWIVAKKASRYCGVRSRNKFNAIIITVKSTIFYKIVIVIKKNDATRLWMESAIKNYSMAWWYTNSINIAWIDSAVGNYILAWRGPLNMDATAAIINGTIYQAIAYTGIQVNTKFRIIDGAIYYRRVWRICQQ